jgi:heme exporter protein CcmD
MRAARYAGANDRGAPPTRYWRNQQIAGGGAVMNILEWMKANPLTYVWIGSYVFSLIIFAIEIVMVVRKRKTTLQQVRLMRDAGDEE